MAELKSLIVNGVDVEDAVNNMHKRLFDTNYPIGDLDHATIGRLVMWTTNTVNTPVSNMWGCAITYAVGINDGDSSYWIWQIAFTTTTNAMYVRRNINYSGWSSWLTFQGA